MARVSYVGVRTRSHSRAGLIFVSDETSVCPINRSLFLPSETARTAIPRGAGWTGCRFSSIAKERDSSLSVARRWERLAMTMSSGTDRCWNEHGRNRVGG